MGIKDRLGIKEVRDVSRQVEPPEKTPAPRRSRGVGRDAATTVASFAQPALKPRPVVKARSPLGAKAPANGTVPVNGKAPVKGRLVLEGQALLPQKPPIQAKPVLKVKPPAPKVNYDCSRCPGYCCSYPRIEVKPSDVRRLAAYHGISVEQAERKFTRIYWDDGKPERILRHQKDTVYKTICRFFDTELRRCTIYEGRPQVCREYPNGRNCGYYTFIRFERKHQDDDTFIPSA